MSTGQQIVDQAAENPRTPSRSCRWRDRLAALAACAALFFAVAFTLPWLEFSNASESLIIATAVEVRRTGQWLTPTLDGELRTKKPPLPTWLTAAAIPDHTLQGMSDPARARREAAQRALSWQARWPSLAAACLCVFAVFELAYTLADRRASWIAAAAFASTLMVLRASRAATTDIHLALWVVVANLFLARALVAQRRWTGAAGAGAALGLAMMSKGPVALAQTLVPAVAYVLWRAWDSGRHAGGPVAAPPESRRGPWLGPLILGTLLAAAIGLPWFALVMAGQPDVLREWRVEVMRDGATGIPPGHWYNYLVFLPLLMPWMAFFIAGVVVCIRDRRGNTTDAGPPGGKPADGPGPGAMLALMMALLPIVVMSFFPDRKDRYLLPMAGPAAVVIAVGVLDYARQRQRRTPADRALVWVHWACVAAFAVGLPVAGALFLRTVDGRAWYGPWLALASLAAGAAATAWGVAAARRRPLALVPATLAVMLIAMPLFVWGYRNSENGRSEMRPLAELVWESCPDALFHTHAPGKRKRAPADLSIYLNREIRWCDDPAAIVPLAGRAAALVLRQEDREAPEPTPPPGWRRFATVPRRESFWHAFVLDGSGDQAGTAPNPPLENNPQ